MSLALETIRFYTGLLLPPAPIPFWQRRCGIADWVQPDPEGRFLDTRIINDLIGTMIGERDTTGSRGGYRSGRSRDDQTKFSTLPLAAHEQ